MKKEIKETAKDREIYALRHQISAKDKRIKELNAKLKISDARMNTQAIINGFLLDKLSPDKEYTISTNELAGYISDGKLAVWKEEDGVISIKTVKQ